MSSYLDRINQPITNLNKVRLLFNPTEAERSVYYTQIRLYCPPKSYVRLREDFAQYLLAHQPRVIDADVGFNPLHPPDCGCGCDPHQADAEVMAEYGAKTEPIETVLPMPGDAPDATWAKARIITWAEAAGITFRPDAPKSEMLEKISSNFERATTAKAV